MDEAIADCFAGSYLETDYQIVPCRDKKFGDYQTNLAFLIANREKTSPRGIAGPIVKAIPENDVIETIDVAGAGFINIRLKNTALVEEVERILADQRCGVPPVMRPRKIVVDYSSPNLAKDLHVGTMRSTVIGDSIARTLEFLGHEVLRQNHYGDWGTNFGVLVAMIKQEYGPDPDKSREASLEEVEELYTRGSKLKATDPGFAGKAGEEVNNLQSGNPASIEIWQILMEKTLRSCHELYAILNVSLDASHDCPESSYKNDLPLIIEELSGKKMLVENNNAKCVYLDGYHNVDGDPLPVIVQKSDGGYNYSTTDLAMVRYRVNHLGAEEIIIVTDRGQQLHFQMIEDLTRKAGWLTDAVQLRHLGYGVILKEVDEGGQTKKVRFKTSKGGTVKIRELFDEGRLRSRNLTLERNPDVDKSELNDIAEKLTIAALKYSDLKQRPESDYIFNWDQMLANQGNTGIYIMYCHVRILSLFNKSGIETHALLETPSIIISHKLERELLLQVISFPDLFTNYEEELTSHNICSYLYELSSLYSQFWKDCPILTAGEDVRHSRLILSLAVSQRLKLGLSLLGIDVVARM